MGGPASFCFQSRTAVLHIAFSSIVLAVIKQTALEDQHTTTDHQEPIATKTCHKRALVYCRCPHAWILVLDKQYKTFEITYLLV